MLTSHCVYFSFGIAALSAFLAIPCGARAQPAPAAPLANPQPQPAQLAVPFGVVEGQLVVSGHNLMFIDQQNPGNSFTIPSDDIRNVSAAGSRLTIDLSRPVQDSAGPTSRLVFRMTNPIGAEDFTQWVHQTQGLAVAPAGTADRAGLPNAPPVTMSFEVKHNHRIGSDTGRLLVTPNQINYESVSNLNNSRQWNFSDIKEVKRDGPYKLKIVPFSGDTYDFELMGQGITSDQYHMLVDDVTRARLPRH
jgi:hypothetical protein